MVPSLILVKQGAEARVFESVFVGKRSFIKERFSKIYRHPSLDSKINLKRLNALQARCMKKARRLGVSTPVLHAVDPVLHTLTFEYVEGPSVKDIFLEFGLSGVVQERLDDIASQIGVAIGKLHDVGLVHGPYRFWSELYINASKRQSCGLICPGTSLDFNAFFECDKPYT
ncbi:EKC/KEOPS complex subunit bud32-like isoform X3 [Durio zibethinus]|uniref:non-specific serine/threonine protein kinase n=1 Tax=Durio zibethinus TaxID=66656 RepID=A0A6P5XHW7_DURZI|nr:EKC/KEOPS complex subunit bud32-like isoform X3 [Durio zibethinus]